MSGRQIVLMRHGQPVLPDYGWLPASAMRAWIDDYDRAAVDPDGVTADALTNAKAARVIATSTAPRALSSVQALGLIATTIDSVFCEARLPHAAWGSFRLPPAAWAALFRVLWFCGFSRGADSLAATRLRAKSAARLLIGLAAEGPVLLLGHGIMNRLIARELAASGWRAQARPASAYWSASTWRLAA